MKVVNAAVSCQVPRASSSAMHPAAHKNWPSSIQGRRLPCRSESAPTGGWINCVAEPMAEASFSCPRQRFWQTKPESYCRYKNLNANQKEIGQFKKNKEEPPAELLAKKAELTCRCAQRFNRST